MSVLGGSAEVAFSLPAARILLGDRADECLGIGFLLYRRPFTTMVTRLGDSDGADPVFLMAWRKLDAGVRAVRGCSDDAS